jgi:hypothetical protein
MNPPVNWMAINTAVSQWRAIATFPYRVGVLLAFISAPVKVRSERNFSRRMT